MLDPILPFSFYQKSAPDLAVALLGCPMVRRIGDQWVGGIITETEAYTEDDEASHSFRGMTARNAAMFQKPGTLYVYRIYGIHFCLNISSGDEGRGEAVLIRSIQPLWGIETMRKLRLWPEPKPIKGLCNGPGKLAQALAIDLSLNGVWPGQKSDLQLGPATQPVEKFSCGPRVGITKNVERAWRFQASTHL
ncbi:MAG TPA: DNA-3-methyladenine glycosylase [Oligoflexus sp.]|uniref:DNA-3-methyladenine glycosylase n=1 Tax=Oligoflexus sp. TaxID=1971216 RepID=UPI002D5CE329|nr:DNA-3-methyladenine glycosylase [Oligoflexus sp.]HYX31679.1 DNA-3-methyladenine glycosylase [Oligoflexus sp.]